MKKIKALILFILTLALSLTVAGCGGGLGVPEGFSLDENDTLSWDAVANARAYHVQITPLGGEATESTTRRTNYSLSDLAEGDYDIRVMAVGGANNAEHSEWSPAIAFHKNYESGLIYTSINNNTQYEVTRIGSASGDLVIEGDYRGKPVTRIADSACRASSSLTSLVIGENIVSIGDSAFYNCTELTSVVLPESVVSVGQSAFQGCNQLRSVNLPEGVTVYPAYLFAYCRSLEAVEIGPTVRSIGESAFYACSSLKEATIPDSVSSIGPYAFSSAEMLETVKFGTGLQMIGTRAFSVCASLRSVEFAEPDGELTIGNFAFERCPALGSIALPEGTVSIGDQAFYEASSLTEVEIPSSVRSVGAFAFNETALYLDQIGDESQNGFVYAQDWIVATTREAQASTVKLTEEMFRPDTVGIAAQSFIGYQLLEEATFPESVKYLGNYAFYGCPKLWKVVTPENGLKTIGSAAFYACELLRNLQFGDGLESIGRYAFCKCTLLDNNYEKDQDGNIVEQGAPIVPDSVTQIGLNAFRETKLYSEPDEYGVVYAGHWVVGYGEGQLQNIVILRDNTMGIADYAFYAPEQMDAGLLFYVDAPIENITGLHNVRHIGEGAFFNCNRLTLVTLNSNVREIAAYAFANCTSLFGINFPTRLNKIGAAAFFGCNSLRDLDLLDTDITEIGDYAFAKCGHLDEVYLSETLEKIGSYAFFRCTSLTEIAFPESLEEIGERAFVGCEALQTVTFNTGLRTIGDRAFKDCFSLTSVALPEGLVSVGNYAFYHCDKLSSVSLGGTQYIGDYAFGKTSIVNLYLPSTVRSVGNYAFRNCSELKSVYLGSGIESIGSHAFYGCDLTTFYTDAETPWQGNFNSSFRTIVYGCAAEENYVYSVTVGRVDNRLTWGGISAPGRDGYEFVGWSYTEGSEQAEVSAEELLEVPEGTTLYSVWRVAPEPEPEPEPETPEAGDEETVAGIRINEIQPEIYRR